MITVDRLISILQTLDPHDEVLMCIADEMAQRIAKVAPDEAAHLLGTKDGIKIITRKKS